MITDDKPKSMGDWYCKNCGYLAAERVTLSETCDTCHVPVEWHSLTTIKEIEKLRAEVEDQHKKTADLQRLCERAHLEIKCNFQKLCGEDGYGPANLERDLRKAAEGKEYKEFRTLNDLLFRELDKRDREIKELRAEVERVTTDREHLRHICLDYYMVGNKEKFLEVVEPYVDKFLKELP